MAYLTDAARWRAPNSEGHFIYSIKPTNIYCRPTCPGRLARRTNISFYSALFEAEAAGFIACKHCKSKAVLEDLQERAVEKARMLIDEALSRDEQK
ncbi:Ada Adenosine deaminase [Pyrenophora teres f. maculata]|nr:Ada Adenosine deaminase [Pyrenophora teres f. maculata]